MDRETIKTFLTPDGVKTLMTEFKCSEDYVRKVCYQGIRKNHKLLLRAIDIAIENKRAINEQDMEVQQKLEQLKQA